MVLKPGLDARREFSRIRLLFGMAQRSIRELRAARLLTRYNPNQQRVPTGNPRGGQWTSESGGTGLPRTQWAQLRPRRVGGGSRLVGGRFVETTPGQEARLDVSAAEARALVREVQRHDPTWRPTPSIYEGIEGQILGNRSDAQQARTRLGALGLND